VTGGYAYTSVPELVDSAARRHGSQLALVTADKSETFAELARRVRAVAASLRAGGVAPGERLLLVCENSVEAVHGWLGCIQAGAVPAAVNPELTAAELRYLATDLQPAAVLTDGQSLRAAHEIGCRTLQVAELDAGNGALEAPATDPLATAAIVYTSGTTSKPKGVQVRHAAYSETGRSFPGWIGLGERECLWACLPLFHINAQAYSLMTALAHGFPMALSDRFHATTFWSDAGRLGATSVNLIGAMLAFLERQSEDAWVDSGLRTIYAAPAPVPDQRRRLEARFRVRITGGYGMSENTFGCAESPTSREKPGSVGRPRQPVSGAFVNELRIVRHDGSDAEGGEPGQLCFRNPVLTPGYWNAADVTARTIVDGWLRTGDLGYRDADGDVFLSGRSKEMIRRRGENIAPAEVEAALLEHPQVESAAVFGIPSADTEEEVVAAVVPRGGGLDEEALRSFAAERLARYKVPSVIVFRSSLPMTPTMRVAKEVLRHEYLEGGGEA
jgi:crotonobetaine/carnitine-CoA ligase